MMSKEEKAARIEIGNRCKELMQSDAFRSVVTALQTTYITDFIRLEPGSSTQDERERLHLKLHALSEIEQEIQMRIAVAEELLASFIEDEEFKND